MAGVKLKLKPRYAHLFDNHAKGEPRQRIAHLYQTIRMRPAMFSKHIKDMDNVKPACAVIFRRCVQFWPRIVEKGKVCIIVRWTFFNSRGKRGIGNLTFHAIHPLRSKLSSAL